MKIFFSILILIISVFFYIFSSSETIPVLEDIEDFNNKVSISKEHTNSYLDKKYIEYKADDTQLQSIPQEQTFDTIKKILNSSKSISYNKEIILNSKISSFINDSKHAQKFKNSIASSFNLSYEEVNKSYKQNKLVWDWVNQLKD